MTKNTNLPEFRFYYFTNRYSETVSFYRDLIQLQVFRSWDRGPLERGTIFHSPNGTAFIEIEEGPEGPTLLGCGLYIQVEDVDGWYNQLISRGVKMIQSLTDTAFGHRSFKFADPNGLEIGLFRYNSGG